MKKIPYGIEVPQQDDNVDITPISKAISTLASSIGMPRILSIVSLPVSTAWIPFYPQPDEKKRDITYPIRTHKDMMRLLQQHPDEKVESRKIDKGANAFLDIYEENEIDIENFLKDTESSILRLFFPLNPIQDLIIRSLYHNFSYPTGGITADNVICNISLSSAAIIQFKTKSIENDITYTLLTGDGNNVSVTPYSMAYYPTLAHRNEFQKKYNQFVDFTMPFVLESNGKKTPLIESYLCVDALVSLSNDNAMNFFADTMIASIKKKEPSMCNFIMDLLVDDIVNPRIKNNISVLTQ